MTPKLLVVVVAYGREDQLERCLSGLGVGTTRYVVDNGQSDRAREVSTLYGWSYVRTPHNIGFAAAANLAIRSYRQTEMDVLLLNPDACLRDDALQQLRISLHAESRVAAVGPRLLNNDGSEQKALWPFPSPWTSLAGILGGADRLSRHRFLSGAVLLMNGKALDDVGLFDERFFLYSEETDWQKRALRRGWTLKWVPESLASHESGGTSSDPIVREALFNMSTERYIRKWYGSVGWQFFRFTSLLTASRRYLTCRDSETKAVQRRLIVQLIKGPARYGSRFLSSR